MPTLSDDELWTAAGPALAPFAEDLRIVAGGPAPEPRPGLVALMRRGVVRFERTPLGKRRMLVRTAVGRTATTPTSQGNNGNSNGNGGGNSGRK